MTSGRHEPLRWGIVGLGQMAGRFATSIGASARGRVEAVASRDPRRAEAFAREHSCRAHVSYHDLFADPAVDAVYVASVNSAHRDLAEAAMAAGKAALVEKPMAGDAASVRSMVAAAERSGTPLVEGYMYRFHPRTVLLRELVRDGAIGEIFAVSASYAFEAGPSPAARLVDPALGGGGILDVGGYPVSLARLVARAGADAAGATAAAEPVRVGGDGTVGATGVDVWACARLTFPSGMVATVSCGIEAAAASQVSILGSRGHIVIDDPWQPRVDEPAAIHLTQAGRGATTLEVPPADQYAAEADAVHRALLHGEEQAPEMTWIDSLGNAAVLDAWRTAVLQPTAPGPSATQPQPLAGGPSGVPPAPPR